MTTQPNRRDSGFQALEQRQLLSANVEAWLFANGSDKDGHDLTLNTDDEAAIYTGVKPADDPSWIREENVLTAQEGITGLMFDILDTGGQVSAKDFVFETVTVDRFGEVVKTAEVEPSSFQLRKGKDSDDADRVSFAFTDKSAIKNATLRVTIAANKETGLSEPVVLYFRSNAPSSTPSFNAVTPGLTNALGPIAPSGLLQASQPLLIGGGGFAAMSSGVSGLTAAQLEQKEKVIAAFEYVYNNIELDLYVGRMRTVEGVERTGYGNDYDQAALLVSKVDEILGPGKAKIRYGDITVSGEELRHWSGLTLEDDYDEENNQSFYRNWFYKHSFASGDDMHRFRHFWVEIDEPTLGWDKVEVDPSWKFENLPDRPQTLKQIGLDDATDFDLYDYANQYEEDPLEWYESQIRDYIASSELKGTVGLSDIAYDGEIIRKRFSDLPSALPYSYSNGGYEGDANADDLWHRLEIKFYSDENDTNPAFTETVKTALYSDLDYHIRYSGNTNNRVAELYRGSTVRKTASIAVGTTKVAVEMKRLGLPSWFGSSQVKKQRRDVDKPLHIYMDVGQFSEKSIAEKWDGLNTLAVADSSSTKTPGLSTGQLKKYQRELMSLTAAKYGQILTKQTRLLAGYSGMAYSSGGVSYGLIIGVEGATAKRYETLQNPYVFYDVNEGKGITLDIPGGTGQQYPVDGNNDRLMSYRRGAATIGSYYESGVIEDLLATESVSTAKGMQWAVFKQSSPIQRFAPYATTSDQGKTLDQLFGNAPTAHADATRLKLAALINAGAEVFVPKKMVEMNDWSGFVWYYFINGDVVSAIQRLGGEELNGGSQSDPDPVISTTQGSYAGFSLPEILATSSVIDAINHGPGAGDPVNTASGSFYQDETDFTIPLPGTQLTFSRHYETAHEHNRGLGTGWSYTFSDFLTDEDGNATGGQTPGDIVWTTGAGQKRRFIKNGSGYKNPDGLFGLFEKISGGYQYTEIDGTSHRFANDGRLLEFLDRRGVGFSVSYVTGTQKIDIVRFESPVAGESKDVLDFNYSSGDSIVKINEIATSRRWDYDVTTTTGGKDYLKYYTSPAPAAGEDLVVTQYQYYGSATPRTQGLMKEIRRFDGADYRAHTQLEYYANRRVYSTHEVHTHETTPSGTTFESNTEYFTYDQFKSSDLVTDTPVYTSATTHIDYNGDATKYLFGDAGMLERTIYADRDRVDQTWLEYQPPSDLNDPGTGQYLISSREGETGLLEEYFYDSTGAAQGPVTHGNLTWVTRPDGTYTEYEFDPSNDNALERVSDTGLETLYTYDSAANLLSETDPTGRKTRYSFLDDYGRPSWIFEPKSLDTGVDKYDHGTRYTYDSVTGQVSLEERRLTSGATPSAIASYTYDSNGYLDTHTDGTGRVTQTVYDNLGRLRESKVDPSGLNLTTEYVYRDDLVLEEIQPDGRKTVNTYDVSGKLISQTSYGLDLSDNQVFIGTTAFDYDAMGRVTETIDAFGQVTDAYYDSRGRVKQTIDAFGGFTLNRYDAAGRLVSTVSPADSAADGYKRTTALHVSSTKYNALGRVQQVSDALGQTTGMVYDAYGRAVGTDNLYKQIRQTEGGHIVIDAVDYDDASEDIGYGVWQTVSGANTGGDLAIGTLPDSQKWTTVASAIVDAPRVSYEIYFEDVAPGTQYYVWILGNAADQQSDSLHIGIDGQAASYTDSGGQVVDITHALGINSFAGDYEWRDRLLFPNHGTRTRIDAPSEGVHTLDIWVADTGAQLDQIILTTDPNFDPGDDPAAPSLRTFNLDPYSKDRLILDDAGRVLEERGTDGTAVVHTYDSNGNLDTSTVYELNGDSNRLPAFVADLEGYDLSQVPTDWRYVTDYTYDQLNRLTEVQDAEDNTRKTEYDAAGRVTKEIDPRDPNYYTEFVYDDAGRLWKTRLPDRDGATGGVVMTDDLITTYDALGRVLTQTDANGNLTQYQYREIAGVETGETEVRVQDAEGGFTYRYTDALGRVTKTIDAEGNETLFEHDALGRVIQQTAPAPGDGSHSAPVSYWSYNHAGDLERQTNTDGLITEFVYDGLGRVVTETVTNGDDQSDLVTSYEYENNNLVSVTDRRDYQTRYVHDKAGRVVQTFAADTPGQDLGTNNAYLLSSNEYYTVGWLKAGTVYSDSNAGSGATTEYDYDKLGRLWKQRDPNETNGNATPQRKTVYLYDEVGNVRFVTNAAGETTEYRYDGRNQRTFKIDPDPDGTGPRVSAEHEWRYDDNGNLEDFIDGEGNLTHYDYDGLNRLASETTTVFVSSSTPTATATKSYAYDGNSNLTRAIDAEGRVRVLAYDDLDRMTSEQWYDSVADADANGGAGTNLKGEYVLTYDVSGRLLTADSDPGTSGVDVTYVYNNLGWMTDATDHLAGVERVYVSHNVLGQSTEVKYRVGGSFNDRVYSVYDDHRGLLTGRSSSNNDLRVTVAYQHNGQLETVRRYHSASDLTGGTEVDPARRSYVYDGADQLERIEKGPSNTVEHDYVYDPLGRVTDWTVNGVSQTYTYHEDGQLKGADGKTFTYDDNGNRVDDGSDSSSIGAGNRLAEDAAYTYVYDLDGNLVSKTNKGDSKVTAYAYDHRQRLVEVVQPASGGGQETIAYGYNAAGQRISKSIDGQLTERYSYEGSDLKYVMSVDGTGQEAVKARYLRGAGQILAEDLASTPGGTPAARWLFSDHLGSVREVQDETGTVIKTVAYDAYGNQTESGSGDAPLFKYTGQLFDDDTGLYDYKARWYDASTGRFLNPDPAEFGTNHYVYVENDPLNFTDPTGLTPQANFGGAATTGKPNVPKGPAQTPSTFSSNPFRGNQAPRSRQRGSRGLGSVPTSRSHGFFDTIVGDLVTSYNNRLGNPIGAVNQAVDASREIAHALRVSDRPIRHTLGLTFTSPLRGSGQTALNVGSALLDLSLDTNPFVNIAETISQQKYRIGNRFDSTLVDSRFYNETVSTGLVIEGITGSFGGAARLRHLDNVVDLTPNNTNLFHNKFPDHVVGSPIQTFTPAQISSRNFNRKLNYVVREDGSLVLGRIRNEVGGGHIDLAGGQAVQAAGEVKIVGGQIRYLDNASGHYQPSGSVAQEAAERAFQNAGLDVSGKYVERAF